eukprot:515383-Karenia_brevis.AAC.1
MTLIGRSWTHVSAMLNTLQPMLHSIGLEISLEDDKTQCMTLRTPDDDPDTCESMLLGGLTIPVVDRMR